MKSFASKEIFVPLTSNVNESSFSNPCIISSGFVSEKISSSLLDSVLPLDQWFFG